jgi:hypothetical protein
MPEWISPVSTEWMNRVLDTGWYSPSGPRPAFAGPPQLPDALSGDPGCDALP